MNNKINFDFVSPEASIVSSEVDMVLIPGVDGDAGILPDHSPFMTTLRQGIVEVTFEQGNVKKYLVEGGFADITQDKMTILAETSLNLSDSDSKVLKSEIDIINEKLASAEEDEKVLLDERKSLIENFI
ncbi:MAG: ATP synthase F1 subunit epsilon [Pseudomonadota bacterium]|nr:ATP synthase F1 subunit epsilon [Pseudomonadota bacterium]MEC7614895.1 ATP synthase F1 subunit epsilon [Pseudomonadota bacterium]MEC7958521.1 ATP synthase F1 subunit epsilon [Pseudomonadota bacterium]MEC8497500.1 ATP synthase F1 subunit epsilon [Pseudomonadota bacterium]MEC8797055.1 ATP synthase F1 subunit epsilon [Pseudomonadota bacterium]|tara:strand:- start:6706 stop:7092 length:387 start_codon:yes stop_codon:yes gene_type:complete